MRQRSYSMLVACAVVSALALGLRALLPSRVVTEPPPEVAAAPAPPETLALPRFVPGATHAEVAACFAPGVIERQLAPAAGAVGETWEWSEPAGRYALAMFEGGRLQFATVRRPYVDLLPAVEASRLPALRAARSRADVEGAIGAGWPVARAIGRDGDEAVTYAWAIRDRGVGTGGVLRVTCRGESVAVVDHSWARP